MLIILDSIFLLNLEDVFFCSDLANILCDYYTRDISSCFQAVGEQQPRLLHIIVWTLSWVYINILSNHELS